MISLRYSWFVTYTMRMAREIKRIAIKRKGLVFIISRGSKTSTFWRFEGIFGGPPGLLGSYSSTLKSVKW